MAQGQSSGNSFGYMEAGPPAEEKSKADLSGGAKDAPPTDKEFVGSAS